MGVKTNISSKGLLGRLRPLWFFSAFVIGLLFCFVLAPKQRVVVKFPSPYNAGRIVYRDTSDSCFKINADEVTCPKEGVLPQPLSLEDFKAKAHAHKAKADANPHAMTS